MINQIRKIEALLGNVKFAVVIILFFTVCLIIGTFVESYNGTDYANRLVYKSIPFMAIQGLMFLSIFTATLQRLPFKKKLAGFYVLHAGLLILFIGSFATYYAGIDGNITLEPNKPNNEVVLNQDVLFIRDINRNKEVTYTLPYSPFARNINFEYEELTFTDYYPYAENKTVWVDNTGSFSLYNSSQYRIQNDRFSESITVSLHPDSSFKSSAQLGPLSVHYLPKDLFTCFKASPDANFIIWNMSKSTCAPANQSNSHQKTFSFGQDVLIYIDGENKIPFIPSMSPMPVKIVEDEKNPFQVDQTSPFRVFNRALFKDSPHLFVFGTGAAYYDKDEEKWVGQTLNKDKPIDLPWMGFELTLLKNEFLKRPMVEPYFAKPIQDNNQIIHGKGKALRVSMTAGGKTQRFWLQQDRGQKLSVGNSKYEVYIKRSSVSLPFELNLTRFKMDTDPGTRNPASYESFVHLFSGEDSSKHHVYMNNPLKHNNLTFYQASYFPIGQNQYGSVLSVNYDPGRSLKYFGSLLLVLGSWWHFILRKKKPKKTLESKA
jgi:hypothetical protein